MTINTLTLQSQFRDPNTPIRVLISPQGTGWHEQIHPSQAQEMDHRRNQHDSHYRGQWQKRNGKHGEPRYNRGQHRHLPVTAYREDWARFECEVPFMVVIVADPEVDLVDGSPLNPFSGTDQAQPFCAMSQLTMFPDGSSQVTRHAVQAHVSSGVGAQDQIFYKMFFVVLDNSGAHFVDPDFDSL